MAATVNLELDPVFLKALGFLHSKSKDSAEKLKALLDESLSRGIDSCYRPQQKEVDQPKVSIPKPVSVKTTPSLPTSNNNGKPIVVEKVKKEVEKRIADKVKVEISEGIDIPSKKPRLEKAEAHASSITVQTSKDLPMADLSSFEETSADDFAMEMGLACVVCRQITVTSGNPLVECQECHNFYHQDCHKPQVTDKEMNDPRVVWYCARCTRQLKKMAQKTQKPSQKPAPAVVSVAPAVKDPLIKKPEIKLKLETTPAFLAFKRTEVKTSATMSGNSTTTNVSSSSNSGLTGWAAFAKTSSAGPSTAKMGSATQSTSGKPVTGSNNQKPTGLSGLATTKGVGSKITSAGSTNPSQLKPLPPLTLGKVGLSRSVSSDNVSKIGLPNAGSSTPGNSQTIGGNGSSVAAGSSASKSSTESGNQSPSLKGPTSQESQLNAMKRLQMVKKKAAQKKLKK
ncbi:PREDICTED: integrator complex subunit 12 [Thamnophis sirtalis]|uniref:Integrator complex subunit 12 n=1 Tax=Thamnophis sirtalis TaxID=35019 RepID=A0A6I9XNQ5_9SAUR|nr:PREDICTED: integrator complex subunit 12 [Thamnophis sirtalis]